ncbi:hypothetical protein [Candidatus Parabeggiatoa sp. HSG14]|uniref:hypothetical protein n=1 Tax=Candidatus Parabeggiatoa sp. HSG14 TaxID=3055593 RepID=UPI0025A73093|nr:hypothetical protein [Thiotrichales bacterium HSG14]
MKILKAILLLSWVVIASCGITRAIYGVPEEEWKRMSEAEQQTAIERFKQQEEINAKTRVQAEKAKEIAEQSKPKSEEFAQKCHEIKDDISDLSEECNVITRRRFGF